MTFYLNNNECVFDNLVIIKNEILVTVLKKNYAIKKILYVKSTKFRSYKKQITLL